MLKCRHKCVTVINVIKLKVLFENIDFYLPGMKTSVKL